MPESRSQRGRFGSVLAYGTVAVGSAPDDVGDSAGTDDGAADMVEDGVLDATDTLLPAGAEEAGAEETNAAR